MKATIVTILLVTGFVDVLFWLGVLRLGYCVTRRFAELIQY